MAGPTYKLASLVVCRAYDETNTDIDFFEHLAPNIQKDLMFLTQSIFDGIDLASGLKFCSICTILMVKQL